jgi:peptidoglycan/xylan/chitin deacetylase (PgdA/CDA1 family)
VRGSFTRPATLATKRIKIAISLVWFVGDAIGRFVRRLAGRHDERLVVLYYHGISASAAADFARQMQILARRAHVVAARHTGTLPSRGASVAITFDDAFQSVAERALPELVRRGFPCTIFAAADTLGQIPAWKREQPSDDPDDHVMTLEGLQSLPDLVEIGSHTRTHPNLAHLDAATLYEELAGSREQLSRDLGVDVSLLAFPYGSYDDRVIAECLSAGYTRVFNIVPALVDPRDSAFVRGRVGVDPRDSSLEFFLKMRGAYAWMRFASPLKQAVLRRGGR